MGRETLIGLEFVLFWPKWISADDLNWWLSIRMILPLGDILQHLETFLVVTAGGSTTGIENRDTIKHPMIHRTASPTPTKNYQAPMPLLSRVRSTDFSAGMDEPEV